MGEKTRSVRRARRQRTGVMRGYIVTWDVDSHDSGMCSRLKRFVFGQRLKREGREYRYPGFVERDGVRYLGQSVVFVNGPRRQELEAFLGKNGIQFHSIPASIGPA